MAETAIHLVDNVIPSVKAHERERLEKLLRYMTRPPFSEEHLQRTEFGKVRIKLKSPWRDGTTHIELTPFGVYRKISSVNPYAQSAYRQILWRIVITFKV